MKEVIEFLITYLLIAVILFMITGALVVVLDAIDLIKDKLKEWF